MMVLNENTEYQWKSIYRLGATTSLFVIFGTILDIVIGTSLGGDLSTVPISAVDKFTQFNQNWLLGLYNLDFLNLINTTLMIPTYFALWAAHRRDNIIYVTLAAIIYFIGAVIFITNNAALPMLELSYKYAAITNEDQRILLAAAGEAMIVRGAHGSLGAFAGFFFLTIGSIIMSLGMLKGKVFSKLTGYLGLLGGALLLIYIFLVTLVPEIKDIAVMVAAPGGLLALAWMIMFNYKLFLLTRYN